jgi:translation initiation factor 5B
VGLLRQPIISVLGHVDTGKTSLLDKIRGSAVALREVGSMTQHIGASFFPIEVLTTLCGPLIERTGGKLQAKGLLVIDTPGHRAFMNLRRRGGSVADIAVLVIDIVRGFEEQTYESLGILQSRRTPFVVAANKVDLIPGWVGHENRSFAKSFTLQAETVQRRVDEHLYMIMGTLSRKGFDADRYDRVNDFAKTLAIVPVSAKTGEGIPELLTVVIGLTQQFMQERLKVSAGPARGTILEVKEEPGLGLTLNAIIYDGVLRKGDTVVAGGVEGTVTTKIRSILLPKPLDEIRDPRERFTPVDSVPAAAGVKIAAPDVEGVIPGAPLYAIGPGRDATTAAHLIADEVGKLRVKTDVLGVILKADTLGSLEAITSQMEVEGIPIRLADVGDVSRREIVEASLIRNDAPLQGVVLAFNVKVLPDALAEAETRRVPVFQSDVVYRLLDDYTEWVASERAARLQRELDALVQPGKMRVLPNLVFRKSKPAVFGIEVVAGRVRAQYPMTTTNGRSVGTIAQIQDRNETINEATTGMKVAVSMRDAVVGGHFGEGDVLYVAVPEVDAKALLQRGTATLSADDRQILVELTQIMRKTIPLWGL